MKTLTALLAVLVTALLAFFPFLSAAMPTVATPAATVRAVVPLLPAKLRAAPAGTDAVAAPPPACTCLPVNAQVPKAFLPFVPLLGMNRLVRLQRGVLRRSGAQIRPLVLRCFLDHPHHAPPALA